MRSVSRSLRRVCAQWSRFGPYHIARLRAAHVAFAARGVELVAFETAGADAVYNWQDQTDGEAFVHEQVFAGRAFETIPPREVVREVTATLDRLDPDAVAINSYSAPDALAALAWCRRRRRTAVCFMESKADDAARSPAREWIKARLVSQFDAALAGGTPQREYLVALGFPERAIFTPYDVVDNAFYRDGAAMARRALASARLPGLDGERPVFLASNRFVARKNLDRLLRAYAAYRDAAEAPWGLVLLGDGPERPALEALVRERGIEGVTFAGFRQPKDLLAYYGLAGAFVHPALIEPWGLVVNEAMAAGLPVLVSDRVGSVRDLVTDGETGLLFDPESEAEMARALARVASMSDAERAALAQRAGARVVRWSPERFGEGLWDAVAAGRERSGRGLDPVAAALMALLWVGADRARAHYALPE